VTAAVAAERASTPLVGEPDASDIEATVAADELRRRFPPRPDEGCWPRSMLSTDEVLALLDSPPFRAPTPQLRRNRRRGTALLLRWLATFPGDSWQERWQASGVEEHDGKRWETVPVDWLAGQGVRSSGNEALLGSGLLMLICADALRPSMGWMYSRHLHQLTRAMQAHRDPVGLPRLRDAFTARKVRADLVGRCLLKISVIMARKGGGVADVAVGDCVEAADAHDAAQRHGQGSSLVYEVLRSLGQFPTDAPAHIRAFRSAKGQRSVEQLVDRYNIVCRPIRDLLVAYLKERQPRLDYTSLEALARTLAGPFFWQGLELHHPGTSSLRLAPEVVEAWKQRAATKLRRIRQYDGTYVGLQQPRANSKALLLLVRAFYLDIAQWAVEDPARWGQWAAPCPVGDADVDQRKDKRHRKAHTDQRTRERLPALPLLVRHVAEQRRRAAARLQALLSTPPGEVFTFDGETLRRVKLSQRTDGVWAQDYTAGAKRRNLAFEEHQAFWGWALVEVLRHTGIRIEELTELTHHSITQYRLPTTGELVPLLQIAPSKTDEERLLLVDPELADVLSAIVTRVRQADGSIPSIAAYDHTEKVWNPPMPLLLQRTFAGQQRPISPAACRALLTAAIAASGLTDVDGEALRYQPHDFRRIFVTDAVMNGLPPHIAQIICGHRNINTTMGYKAIYPAEAIEAHRAFIARRRATRPSEEYRTPTSAEWDSFLAHFEQRKVSVGTCARAFGTPCIHEHACVRCSLLRAGPEQRPRLVEIRDNLLARIAEAEREGWLGEVEGLRISLAGAQDKLTQIDSEISRRGGKVYLGLPSFTSIAARTGPEPSRKTAQLSGRAAESAVP